MSGKLAGRFEFGLLLLDSVLLALLELFFLPLRAGVVPVPVTAVLAAVTLPLLVRRAAALVPTTVGASAPLLVWLVVVLGVGLAGPGGDQVLIPDWRALALLALGLLPAAVALGGALGNAVRARG
ncbi:hypothetical protein [Sciscionella sediminilitoris]|uniref:hypothetical protein n=1 Tax=Sciscionella sediminilitoris TaxID=1445613 RepID=UPI0004DF1BB1|nr:hypothetical protein [Sciscionella sp. SE31]